MNEQIEGKNKIDNYPKDFFFKRSAKLSVNNLIKFKRKYRVSLSETLHLKTK